MSAVLPQRSLPFVPSPYLRLRIEPMSRGDLETVYQAENLIYPFPWTLGNFEDSLESGYGAWICCDRENNKLVGYAVMMPALDEAQLLNISILPERQRQGLGGALLEYLFAEALERGAIRMLLEVRRSNQQAQTFYQQHGFSVIGCRRDYYPAGEKGVTGSGNIREDALVMERLLQP